MNKSNKIYFIFIFFAIFLFFNIANNTFQFNTINSNNIEFHTKNSTFQNIKQEKINLNIETQKNIITSIKNQNDFNNNPNPYIKPTLNEFNNLISYIYNKSRLKFKIVTIKSHIAYELQPNAP